MDPRDLQHIIALYDGEIAWVDAHLRRLVAELKTRGLFDDAIFVLTADHGDEFFEHGRKGHQHSLYEELLHVPLLVRGPGLIGGLTHEERTPLIDVMPTLLETTGTTIPPGLHGSSLWPVLRGGARDPRPVFAETTKALKRASRGRRIESWCVYDGSHKLILFEEDVSPAETYDLSADPGEVESLGWSDSESEIFDVYRTWLDRVPLGEPQKNERIDSETKRTLEALGYVGD